MDQKYKDINPYETIDRVKNFLLELEIMVIERWTINEFGLYSVNLTIDDTTLFVNGKGTTKVYALASAYGEIMERFQNYALFRMRSSIFVKDKLYFSRNYKKCTIEEYKGFHENLVNLMGLNVNEYDLANLFADYSINSADSHESKMCVFKELNKESNLEIPVDMIDYYYGTNGMVAGNTEYEAYVQGLSEVLERYVAVKFITDNITPPKLDDIFLRKLTTYENIIHYIKSIEYNSKFKVDLLDLSMDSGIPAVAIVLYNLLDASYFIKIGVHPSIDIAIERCFTELMQGKNLNSYYGMINLSSSSNILKRNSNIHNFFINGEAAFPISFFVGKPSYKMITDYKKFESNKDMKDYLEDIILKLGYRIFVHNSSSSIMNSYHFIVPGMSEMNPPKEDLINDVVQDVQVSKLMKESIEDLDIKSAKFILDHLNKSKQIDYKTMDYLLRDFAFKKPNIYSETKIIVFKFYLYLIINDYHNAYLCAEKFNCYLGNQNKRSMYFDCYVTLLSYIQENKDLSIIIQILNKFYRKDLVARVIDDFNTYPLKNFQNINCDDICEKCNFSIICLRRNNLIIYRKIRDRV